jgi:hypothetical protein
MRVAMASLLLAAETVTGSGSRDLTAPALASARPAECRPGVNARAEVWRKARSPRLDGYCNLLGRGYSRLGTDPREALEAARRAELVLPGRAATSVLRGRAKLLLGDIAGAWREFERVEGLDSAALVDPAALRDFGVAALETGHRDRARLAFRKLVPRASLLGSEAERQRVYVEAAMLAMSDGADGLAEAVGLLISARRGPAPPGFSALETAALALALDRQGQVERARSLIADVEETEALERWVRGGQSAGKNGDPRRGFRVVLPPGELFALLGMATERTDPGRAVEQWRACVAVAGPWTEHARSKVTALTAKPVARR